MTKPEVTQPEATHHVPNVAGVRRRIGFVALLWWISACAGTLGVMQGMQAGRLRLIFIGLSWVLAILFSYAWWHVGKGSLPE
jgi:hypothetical protein